MPPGDYEKALRNPYGGAKALLCGEFPLEPPPMLRGLRSRVAASILLGVGWLSFVLLYAAFWAGGYSLFQSIAIILVSMLVLAGVLGAMWATWGMRFAGLGRQ